MQHKSIEGNPPKLGNKPRKMVWELGNGKSNTGEKSWVFIEHSLRENPA